MISRCQFKLKHRVPISENIILEAQGIGEFQPIGLIEWHLAVNGQAAAADLPGIVVLFAPDHDAVQPILRHMECPFDVLPGGTPVDPPHHVHPNLAAGYWRIQRAGIVAGGIEGFVGRKGGVFPLDMNGFGRLAGGVSLADLRIGRLVLFLIKADAVQGHGLPHRLQAQRILPFLQVDSQRLRHIEQRAGQRDGFEPGRLDLHRAQLVAHLVPLPFLLSGGVYPVEGNGIQVVIGNLSVDKDVPLDGIALALQWAIPQGDMIKSGLPDVKFPFNKPFASRGQDVLDALQLGQHLQGLIIRIGVIAAPHHDFFVRPGRVLVGLLIFVVGGGIGAARRLRSHCGAEQQQSRHSRAAEPYRWFFHHRSMSFPHNTTDMKKERRPPRSSAADRVPGGIPAGYAWMAAAQAHYFTMVPLYFFVSSVCILDLTLSTALLTDLPFRIAGQSSFCRVSLRL